MGAVLVPTAWILGCVAFPCVWGAVLSFAAGRAGGGVDG